MEEIVHTILDLADLPSDKTAIKVKISLDNQGIYICPEGHGEAAAEDGFGFPILIEKHEDEVRIIVWSDINDGDPTHIIDMKDAQESKRK
jgi:hypothetical protein